VCFALLAVSASATKLATRKANLAARTWLQSHQQPDGDELAELKGHVHEVCTIRFSPSGEFLASGEGGPARCFSVATFLAAAERSAKR